MRPREFKAGQRLGQASEGLIISGYSVVDESGVFRIFIVQTGPKLVEVPGYRLVVFDRDGKRYLPERTDAGGLGSSGAQLHDAVFALDPKVLPPGRAAYLGIELRLPGAQ